MIRFDEQNHLYFDDKGFIVPSVTQIISRVYGTGLENAPTVFVERAAQKGTGIHEEIENYLKTGIEGKTPEFKAFVNWFTVANPKDYATENVVYAKTPYGAFAGKTDFWDVFLRDWKTWKTASRQNIKKSQMQMSHYYYALKQMGVPLNLPLKIMHLTPEGCHVIDVDYLGDEFVEETMRLYAADEKPKEEKKELQTVSATDVAVLEDTLLQIEMLEKVVANIRGKIKYEMEQRGILDVQLGKVKVTYIPGTIRQTFDSKAFKQDDPDLYAIYLKDTPVKPSVRITVK